MMSVAWGRHNKTGFPFTPSRFRGISKSGQASEVQPLESWRLAAAGINSGKIAETQPQSISNISPKISARDHRFITGAGRSSRNHPPTLKLMPLAGFIWGSRTASPRPRTRGEQVVIWVTQGTLQLDFPRTRHMLGAGNLFFIPSGTAFAALPLIDCQGQVLMIAPHLSRDLPRAFPERTTGGQIEPDDASLRQLLLDLATEAQHDTADAQAAIECHLALLALRLERLEPAAKPAQREPRNIPDIPLAERFAVLAENRLADGCAISDLAIELGVTTTELDAACRHKHGKRAIEVLHHLRFRRAAQMLRDTSESPARIARILGYTSLAHLSRSFVEATGRLPEQFRQTH